jgi:hypothetical protein
MDPQALVVHPSPHAPPRAHAHPSASGGSSCRSNPHTKSHGGLLAVASAGRTVRLAGRARWAPVRGRRELAGSQLRQSLAELVEVVVSPITSPTCIG